MVHPSPREQRRADILVREALADWKVRAPSKAIPRAHINPLPDIFISSIRHADRPERCIAAEAEAKRMMELAIIGVTFVDPQAAEIITKTEI